MRTGSSILSTALANPTLSYALLKKKVNYILDASIMQLREPSLAFKYSPASQSCPYKVASVGETVRRERRWTPISSRLIRALVSAFEKLFKGSCKFARLV